jgi:hypothetical protein
MRLLTFLLLVSLLVEKLHSQAYDSQRTEVLVVNVLSNALISGIGGAINRDKGEKIGKAFIRNFFKGSAGGLIKYAAKYQTYYLRDQYLSVLSPFNRLYYFLGHSMVVNSAHNRKLLETYYCNFDGVDIRFNLKAEKKWQARVSLASLGSAIYFASKGFEFDLFRSLEHGLLFFKAKQGGQLKQHEGQALFNCIVIKTYGWNINQSIVPHEIVHTYQMYDMFGVSAFYDKKTKPLYEGRKVYKYLSRFFVADYEAIFFSALYLAQPKPIYFKNYFEFEAEHFKTRSYIKR